MGILPRAGRISRGRDPVRPTARSPGRAIDLARLDPDGRQYPRDPRRPHLDDLPGADDLAVAAAYDRRSGRRGSAPAPRRRPRTKARRTTIEMLALVGFPNPTTALRHLPVRAFGRPAPAGDDRDGADLPAGAVDRRRADHRPRRHHPGADPEADPGFAARARHGAAADHPRPRRRRQHRRGGGRDVSRPGDGERHARRHLRQSAASIPEGAAAAPCPTST